MTRTTRTTTTQDDSLIDVRHMSVVFETGRERVVAVDDISFSLASRASLGIVGESGSGKSVTALSLLRLFGPLDNARLGGEVWYQGRNLVELPERELRAVRGAEIGTVFQDPLTALDPVIPVGRQITESMRHHLGTGRARARRRAVELLELVGIPDPHRRVDDLPRAFSGGMRQRILIAAAIACEPKLLIADEPTTALDVTVQAQILRLLNVLRAELDMAMLLITHDLGVIAATCEAAQVMYAGRIMERGSVGDVLQRGSHPYTQGLMRLVPDLQQQEHSRLRPIPGVPLTVVGGWQGCRFAPRCEYADERCHAEEPPQFPVGSGHVSACWRDENGQRGPDSDGAPTAARR